MTNTLKTIHIRTAIRLFPRDVKYWRKGISAMVGTENDAFHNHQDDGSVFYRPSTIFYRSEKGLATLFGYGDEAVNALLSLVQRYENKPIRLGHRSELFEVAQCNIQKHELLLSAQPSYKFRLLDWVALNGKNFEIWNNTPKLTDRIALLERILVGNILVFCKSIGYQLPAGALEVAIADCQQHEVVRYKDTDLLKFSVVFRTNLQLPPHIALGKAVSHGFGSLRALAVEEQITTQAKHPFVAKKLVFSEILEN
jgi:Cas6b C-terminal domain/Cas6b N-terminal domain